MMTYLVVHLICMIVAFGAIFSYNQNEYPEYAEQFPRSDALGAFLSSLAGPLALLLCFNFRMFKHGLKYPIKLPKDKP